MFAFPIINKTQLPGSDHSQSLLQAAGTTEEIFQQDGKHYSDRHLLYILGRTGESSAEYIFRKKMEYSQDQWL